MSLRGDLRTMALPDVLQWIATGQKTGTLHVERRSVQKRIILREGNIFSSWSNDPRESLGQFLIRLRLVTEEQLFRALLAQEEKGRLLGSILVADGVLGEDDLKRALKAKAEETVFDLFLWPSGQFEFREGEFPDDILITFESPVTPVILEGIRRVDEWQRIKAVFPSMETTVKVKGPPPPGAEATEKQLLGARRGRQEPRRDQPRAAALGVRDRVARLRDARPRRRGGGRGAGREPGLGPGRRDPGVPDARLPAAAGEALRRRAQGLRGRARARPAEPERQEGPDRGDGGAPARAPAPHHPARQGPGPGGRPRHAHASRTSTRRRASSSRA